MATETKTMELKKNHAPAKPVSDPVSQTSEKMASWASSLADVKSEFSKISWTSPEELKVYTKIVVGAALFFGMGIYFADVVIRFSLMVLENAMRWIAS